MSSLALFFMNELSLFSGLDEREKSALSTAFTVRQTEGGEILCKEGEPGTSFFIVARGAVTVYKELPGGRRERLSEVGANHLLGQVALIDGGPRSATLVVAPGTVVLECPRDRFERLYQSGSPFARKIIDLSVIELSRRLREANRQLLALHDTPIRSAQQLREAALRLSRTIDDQEVQQ